METSEITVWFRRYRAVHPDARFMDASSALLAERPEAGTYSAGVVAECFTLAAPH